MFFLIFSYSEWRYAVCVWHKYWNIFPDMSDLLYQAEFFYNIFSDMATQSEDKFLIQSEDIASSYFWQAGWKDREEELHWCWYVKRNSINNLLEMPEMAKTMFWKKLIWNCGLMVDPKIPRIAWNRLSINCKTKKMHNVKLFQEIVKLKACEINFRRTRTRCRRKKIARSCSWTPGYLNIFLMDARVSKFVSNGRSGI